MKCLITSRPAPSTFLLFSLQSMTPYDLEYACGHLGSAAPAVSPHNSLCTPSLLCCDSVRSRKDFGSLQALFSSNYNIHLLPRLFSVQIQNTVKKFNSIPTQTSTVH